MSQTAATIKAEFIGDATNLKGVINGVMGWLKGLGGQVGKFFGDAAIPIAALSASALGAAKILKSAYDFSAEGAQIASLKMASVRLAETYHVSMASIVKSVKDASYNTISEFDAMKSANLAMTMGVSTSASEIANLMQIAVERGRAFGLTTSEAFDRITRGIGRLSPKILDDLGFNMKGIKTQSEMLSAVLEQGNRQLEEMGGLVLDVSVPYQRLSASLKDFIDLAKAGAAYGGLQLIGTPQEIKAANEALAKTAETYDNYYQAKLKAGGAFVDKAGQLVTPEPALSRMDWNIEKRKRDEVNARMQNVGAINTEARAIELMNQALYTEMAIKSDLSDIQQKYMKSIADAMPEPGKKGKIDYGDMNAAFKEGAQAIDDWVFGATTAGLTAEENGQIIRDLGLATNQYTQEEYKAAEAASMISEAIKSGVIKTSKEAKEATDILRNGLKTIMAGGQSNYYIDIWIRTHGGGINPGALAPMTRDFFTNVFKGSGTGMHGGSFVGLAHGGIVMPGYANDGAMVRVSSGERLDVTPAGNKAIENNDLLAEMKAVRSGIDSLPYKLRDAVLLAVA